MQRKLIIPQRAFSPLPHSAAGISNWTSFYTIPTESPMAATGLAHHRLRLRPSSLPRRNIVETSCAVILAASGLWGTPRNIMTSWLWIPSQASHPYPTPNWATSLQYHSSWTASVCQQETGKDRVGKEGFLQSLRFSLQSQRTGIPHC